LTWSSGPLKELMIRRLNPGASAVSHIFSITQPRPMIHQEITGAIGTGRKHTDPLLEQLVLREGKLLVVLPNELDRYLPIRLFRWPAVGRIAPSKVLRIGGRRELVVGSIRT